MENKNGFIVHPYETSDNKYHASYGNNNKTVRSFSTLSEAKSYLKRKGVKVSIYDSPSGNRKIIHTKIRVVRRVKQQPEPKSVSRAQYPNPLSRMTVGAKPNKKAPYGFHATTGFKYW